MANADTLSEPVTSAKQVCKRPAVGCICSLCGSAGTRAGTMPPQEHGSCHFATLQRLSHVASARTSQQTGPGHFTGCTQHAARIVLHISGALPRSGPVAEHQSLLTELYTPLCTVHDKQRRHAGDLAHWCCQPASHSKAAARRTAARLHLPTVAGVCPGVQPQPHGSRSTPPKTMLAASAASNSC